MRFRAFRKAFELRRGLASQLYVQQALTQEFRRDPAGPPQESEPAGDQVEYKTKDTAKLAGVDMHQLSAQETGKDRLIVSLAAMGELFAKKFGTDPKATKLLVNHITFNPSADRFVLAYEPVWAIGTGKAATPAGAGAVIGLTIRGTIAELYDQETAQTVRVQYGGSATSANIGEFMDHPDVDGALVGGASLKPDFVELVRNAAAAKGILE